jgi:anti-sigma B factor antagonist
VERAGEFAVRLETASGNTFVVVVVGELDMATSPELERALEPASPASRLVIDLTACTFVDSSAIRVLSARAHASSAAGGSVAVVAPDSGIRRALGIAAIDRVVELHDDRASAI